MFLPIKDQAPDRPYNAWVTWSLVAANVLVFTQTGADNLPVWIKYGFIPASGTLETAFTSMFLHADIMHLLGNMWFLFLFGDNVELRIGRAKYLIAYLGSGLAGVAGHYYFFPDSAIPSFGASGAVFGVLGMYLYYFPRNRVKFFYWIVIFVGVVHLEAVWVIGFWILKEALMGYAVTVANVTTGTAHWAHAGGFVFGLVCAKGLMITGLAPKGGATLGDWLLGRGGPAREAAHDSSAYGESNGGGWGNPVHSNAGERGGWGGGVPTMAQALEALLEAGQTQEALNLWRRAAAANPHLTLAPDVQLTLGQLLQKDGDAEGARDAFQRLANAYTDRQPYTAESHLALAALLLERARASGDRGGFPEAASHLRHVISTHPQHERRELAKLWLATVEGPA
ncbi:MAG: rhomboid family intramembrane serine protease [Planctomycetes bacterium]|nr:rhomboid family intramembrane serine protease [Planctomycetota bacterium]